MTPGRRRASASVIAATALIASTVVGCLVTGCTVAVPEAGTRPVSAAEMTASPELGAEALAALPEARHDAVIPELAAAVTVEVPEASMTVYSLPADTAVFADDRSTPVARMPRLDFLGQPTVVVPIEADDAWVRVLLPSRQRLPSQSGRDAAAQSSGWIKRQRLVAPTSLERRIVVSVSRQTLSIVGPGTADSTFPAGVGAPGTPTPTGVTGYLQARYLDPAQGQSEHRIQLTSLHSSASDEPFGGSDGGLIGLHHDDVANGAVSHGCIRLEPQALAAVDALPLGTPITILA